VCLCAIVLACDRARSEAFVLASRQLPADDPAHGAPHVLLTEIAGA
jgi:hypothetical protein